MLVTPFLIALALLGLVLLAILVGVLRRSEDRDD
jgi:hypothetical protein